MFRELIIRVFGENVTENQNLITFSWIFNIRYFDQTKTFLHGKDSTYYLVTFKFCDTDPDHGGYRNLSKSWWRRMIDNLAAVVYDSSRAILICLGGEILFITSIIKQLYVNKGEKQLHIYIGGTVSQILFCIAISNYFLVNYQCFTVHATALPATKHWWKNPPLCDILLTFSIIFTLYSMYSTSSDR